VKTLGKCVHTRGMRVQLLHVVMVAGVIVWPLLQPPVRVQQLCVLRSQNSPLHFQFAIHGGISSG
jgi:hypothetical protein